MQCKLKHLYFNIKCTEAEFLQRVQVSDEVVQ